jgi:hypothetical protein
LSAPNSLKNETHSILHARLVPRCRTPISSTAWASVVGTDKYCRGRAARHRGGICARFDRLGEDLAVLDRAINEATVDRP